MPKIPKETDDEKKFHSALDNFNKDILGLIEKEDIDKRNKKFVKNIDFDKITDEFIQKKLRPFIRKDIPTIELSDINISNKALNGLFERSDSVKATTFIDIASTLKQSTDNLSKDINNYIKTNPEAKYGDIHEYLKGKLERENGLTVEYKNGAKVPIEKYVDMVTRTARIETSNVGMINETLNAGGDLVKCSTVTPTCDLCAKYQGRVYSISGNDKRFPSLFDTAFKSGYAVIHPNCRHEFFPYIEEFESEHNRKQDLKDSNRTWDEDSENSNFHQLQRDRDLYANSQAQRRQFNSELIEFKKMKEFYAQRHKPPPYSTIGAFRTARRTESVNWKKFHYIKHDEREYKELVSVIGKEKDIETLDNFQNLKYNNNKLYDRLGSYKRAVKNFSENAKNGISPLTGFTNYCETYSKAEKELIGVTCKNGITIESITEHLIERIIGQAEYIYPTNNVEVKARRKGVAVSAIKLALINPLAIIEVRASENDKLSLCFIGKDCKVSINPTTGKIIQTNPYFKGKLP